MTIREAFSQQLAMGTHSETPLGKKTSLGNKIRKRDTILIAITVENLSGSKVEFKTVIIKEKEISEYEKLYILDEGVTKKNTSKMPCLINKNIAKEYFKLKKQK